MKLPDLPFQAEANSGLKGEGILLRLLYLTYYGAFATWFPFLNLYLENTGMTGLQVGTLSGARNLSIVVAQPLWGFAADLWGRRKTLILSMFFAVVLLPVFGAGSTFWFFLIWVVLYALLSSQGSPLIDSISLDYLEVETGSSFGHLRLWGAVGWAVLAFLTGRLIADRDMRLIFILGSFFLLICFLLVLATPRRTGGLGLSSFSREALGPLLKNRRLMFFFVLLTFVQIGKAPTGTFFPNYMNAIGGTTQQIGLAIAVQGVSELPMYLGAAAIMRRIGVINTVILSLMIFSLRTFLYSIVMEPGVVVGIQILHSGLALFIVACVEYVNRQVPSEWRATGQSLLTAIYMGAGTFLGSLIGGYLYDLLGVQRMYFIDSILIFLTAIMAIFVLRRERRVNEAKARTQIEGGGG